MSAPTLPDETEETSITTETEEEQFAPPSIKERLGCVVILGLLLLIGFFIWQGFEVYRVARVVVQDVQAMQRTGASSDLENVSTRLSSLRTNMQLLHTETAIFYPILPLFGWVPEYGPTIAHAESLIETGVAMSIVVDESSQAISPAVTTYRRDPALVNETVAVQLAEAGPNLTTAREALSQARTAWAAVPVGELAPQIRPLGEQLDVLLPALDVLLTTADAGHEVATVAAPVLAEDGPRLNNGLISYLAEHLVHFETAQEHVREAQRLAAEIDPEQLPPPLNSQFQQVVDVLPRLQDGLELALIAPDMLGADGERTYLLLLQNPDELRPTGGFISGVGVASFDDGKLVSYEAGNSGRFDRYREFYGMYPPAPAPLRQYMGLYIQTLRDANWSPDGPTSAYNAASIYRLTNDEQVDGVVFLTPAVLEGLLDVLDPLHVAGDEEGETVVVTGDTVVDYLHEFWIPAGTGDWGDRKTDYLSRLADAIASQIEGGLPSDRLPTLVVEITRLFNERNMSVVSFHHKEDVMFAERGWTGAVNPGTSDFLMVVDADVGYTKANAHIQQGLEYTVNLGRDSAPHALLEVAYRHNTDRRTPCEPKVAFTEGTYDIMTQTCFWNYFRVLAPAQSRLLLENTPTVPAEWLLLSDTPDPGMVATTAGPAGTTAFEGLLVVPTGRTASMQLYYALPPTVVQQDEDGLHYRLRVQKQPGRIDMPVRVHVRVPPGAVLTASSHQVSGQADRTYSFELLLDRDQELAVSFVLPDQGVQSAQISRDP